VQNPPHITNELTLKQKLTDLILEGRLKAKLFIDHIQFIQGELDEKFRKKVNIDERFMVQKLLAFTNFSKLWLVDDLQTKQKSVLKMILMKWEVTKAKLAEQMALREIALISRVTSPNVVTLLNAFEAEYQEETGYVLQIPYYEHGTLDKRIKEFKANFERTGELFSAKSILGIFIGLLRAIVSVHEAGIIHRDIKPANIIINTASREAAPQDVILIDFGIATAPFDISGMDFTIAGAGTGVGTFGFSAPEQLQSGKVDYSADLYAIGATMYYTMTLNKFPGEFYLPDYANTKYQSISFIYPILQRMLNLAPDERESKTEDIRAIVMQLIKEYKNM
jgi:serine/threonine protein kinase